MVRLPLVVNICWNVYKVVSEVKRHVMSEYLRNTSLRLPLAVRHHREVNPKEDVVPVDLAYPDRAKETFGVEYNPEHKLKYSRGITRLRRRTS
ncbi:hypothetical protein Moror_4345 [Moniliophthora roreri MCA 2997]|uniref:Uncharacterized protein n=1 Tax=Moniliophthora roreri (strain MCA 2997) TaxID=1381753 RepID=V2XIH1_MONRO|nr:hypothetical protein Moror_4345 [Moniliophthora roreri MCA 2997]